MLLPYASDQRPTRPPNATVILMAITVGVTFLLTVGDGDGRWNFNGIARTFGLVPGQLHPWSLVTYPFFHEGFAHLLVNVFYLWVFGAGVEEAVGSAKLVWLYLFGGVVGGGLQVLITLFALPQASGVPIVGASAACACLIGLYAVRYYRARLSFAFIPYRPHVVSLVSLFLAWEIGGGIVSLLRRDYQDGVAHWAHVGGFLCGLMTAQIMGLEREGERAYFAADVGALEQRSPGESVRHWQRKLQTDADNAQARIELARAWHTLGDGEQAGTQYAQALARLLGQNARRDAAQLWVEMRERGIKSPPLTLTQMAVLGGALDESEHFPQAAEILLALAQRDPLAPEAETALLKVVSLYVHRLNRPDDARALLRLFRERYPHSQWRDMADGLQSQLASPDRRLP